VRLGGLIHRNCVRRRDHGTQYISGMSYAQTRVGLTKFLRAIPRIYQIPGMANAKQLC
jgi:hypothetical protein